PGMYRIALQAAQADAPMTRAPKHDPGGAGSPTRVRESRLLPKWGRDRGTAYPIFRKSLSHNASCLSIAIRGLWHAAARAAPRAARPHRRNDREPVPGDCRKSTRADSASLRRRRPDYEGREPMGQSGTAVADALGTA